MKSTKGLSIIEASIVVSLMLILGLSGLFGSQKIMEKTITSDCVRNLSALYNLKRIAYNLNSIDVDITVDNMIGHYFFCNASDSNDSKGTKERYEYDYDILSANESDMPVCQSDGGDTAQENHVVN